MKRNFSNIRWVETFVHTTQFAPHLIIPSQIGRLRMAFKVLKHFFLLYRYDIFAGKKNVVVMSRDKRTKH